MSKATPPSADEDPTRGRKIVFEDDFKRLDTTIWEGGAKATTAPQGYYGRSVFAPIGGVEGVDPYSIVEDNQAENGKALQIAAVYVGRKMNVRNYYGNDLKEFQWVSGNLQTARKDGTVRAGWRRGYFEARMKFPLHPLSWPAFWMLNRSCILSWKKAIELDIVEHKGWEPHGYGAYLHEWGGNEHHSSTGAETGFDLTRAYYRYGMLVEDDRCTPYFERRIVRDTKTGKPNVWPLTRAPEMNAEDDLFWPLLTLALRTDVPFPIPLDAHDKVTHMRVDYFRVYA
ncbi:MAG TPA: family 16 glycosylhydrolase [Polyangiales bacterium]